MLHFDNSIRYRIWAGLDSQRGCDERGCRAKLSSSDPKEPGNARKLQLPHTVPCGVSVVAREERVSDQFSAQLGARQPDGERLEQGGQKPGQPAQEVAKVVAGGGKHGVDAVA